MSLCHAILGRKTVNFQRLPEYRILTLARTSYFAILDRIGGFVPRLVCPLIEIEPRNKDKRKDRDVLNHTVSDFTTLGHVLTFPEQVKQKVLFFW